MTTEADDAAREPTGLWMFDGGDVALHRAHLVGRGGAHALDLLRLARRRPMEPAEGPPTITDGQGVDQLGLVDQVLVDGGFALHRALHHGPRLACRIESGFVADLLRRLCRHGLPLTLAVPRGGCLQTHTGFVDHVEPRDGVVGVVAGPAHFAYGPGDVAEVWVVHTHGVQGPTPVVALMSRSGRCLALLAQLGLPTAEVADAWRDAVGSLPGVAR